MSCLMDGELSRETSLFVIRRLGADQSLAATWQRYHLVRECLRQPGGHLANSDFATRLSDALDNESTPRAGSHGLPGWLRTAASLALTATVALMAVLLVQPGTGPDPSIPASPIEAFQAPTGLPLTTVTQPAIYNPASGAERARLDAYLMRHNQMAGSATRQGFVSYIPVVVAGGNAVMPDDETDDESGDSRDVDVFGSITSDSTTDGR